MPAIQNTEQAEIKSRLEALISDQPALQTFLDDIWRTGESVGAPIESRIWEDKEEWTEIRYRVRNPDGFKQDSFRRITFKESKPRIFAIIGHLKGETKTTVQALRFPKPDWTMAEAKKWVGDHPEFKTAPTDLISYRTRAGIEFRSFQGPDWDLEIRLDEGQPPRLIGHSALFNELSQEIFGFREKIAPGAFTKTLRESRDIPLLFNHDPNYVVARTTNGSLKLREDDRGLLMEATAPPSGIIKDLVVDAVSDGRIFQQSFSFRTIREEWDTGSKPPVRTLNELKLRDVSIVTFPAYPGTDVHTRSIDGVEPKLDFDFLAWLMVKHERGLTLSTDEGEVVRRAIETLNLYLPAAPGLAAHPVDKGTPQPPAMTETLRRRLRSLELVSRNS